MAGAAIPLLHWRASHKKRHAGSNDHELKHDVDDKNHRPSSNYIVDAVCTCTSAGSFVRCLHHFLFSRLLITLPQPFGDCLGLEERSLPTTEECSSIPPSIDWRGTLRVKDQKAFCTCWAVATVSAVESIYYIVAKTGVSLSAQELIDCSGGFICCEKCGIINFAFRYMVSHGVHSDSAYPYVGKRGHCYSAMLRDPIFRIDSYGFIYPCNEAAMLQIVAQQPVVAHVGIIDEEIPGESLEENNHFILIVGYCTFEGRDCWIIQNSWGRNWGMGG
ncbi:hypothetical protein FNV43_RR11384 [Rhamnella rubrinervis]|uniref:Peptidase C1A papain C-terminal domain-containing protein n=1 Tax=Rhamnella rubrinervis TaxID=2594499 RepID=A0A8K0H667_9ROSA|nr:hypothetical protein FNV43_RR11384 [Rhamnella rubrinervis]